MSRAILEKIGLFAFCALLGGCYATHIKPLQKSAMENSSTMNIIRPSGFCMAGLAATLVFDNKDLVQLTPGSRIEVTIPNGSHALVVRSYALLRAKDKKEFTLEKSTSTYYKIEAACEAAFIPFIPFFTLKAIDEKEFKSLESKAAREIPISYSENK